MNATRKRPSKDKILYVIGAGFSRPADAPNQKEIIKNLFDISEGEGEKWVTFQNYRSQLREFIIKTYPNVNINEINITDLYTLLDKAILNREQFRGYNCDDLLKLKRILDGCIIYVFDSLLTNPQNKEYISKFCEYLTKSKTSSKLSLESDNLSIISLNWDILLDSTLYRAFKESNKLIIDYGCRVIPFWGTGFPPAHLFRHKGIYSFKLLKLHGSMNWLHCPSCGRVFAAQEEKISLFDLFGDIKCRLCLKELNEEAKLNSLLITPTFIKNLENSQIKQVWQQAKQEIRRATKIIFLGYSFPESDYEIRYLFKKNIKKDCKIVVVLSGEDDINTHAMPQSEREVYERSLPPNRYKNFFDNTKVNFFFDGVVNYIDKLSKR